VMLELNTRVLKVWTQKRWVWIEDSLLLFYMRKTHSYWANLIRLHICAYTKWHKSLKF
jgi:hypothetical protein